MWSFKLSYFNIAFLNQSFHIALILKYRPIVLNADMTRKQTFNDDISLANQLNSTDLRTFWLLSFHILGLETLWIYKLSEWHGSGSNFRTTELWGFRSSTMGFTTLLSWLTMELYLFWQSIFCTFSLEICETVRLRKYEIVGVTTIEVCCFYNQYSGHTVFPILKIPYLTIFLVVK